MGTSGGGGDRHLRLNDLVIARTVPPADMLEFRMMAHDRWPPPGYVECFRPNGSMEWTGEGENFRLNLVPRSDPLTDLQIRECEEKYLAIVQGS